MTWPVAAIIVALGLGLLKAAIEIFSPPKKCSAHDEIIKDIEMETQKLREGKEINRNDITTFKTKMEGVVEDISEIKHNIEEVRREMRENHANILRAITGGGA